MYLLSKFPVMAAITREELLFESSVNRGSGSSFLTGSSQRGRSYIVAKAANILARGNLVGDIDFLWEQSPA